MNTFPEKDTLEITRIVTRYRATIVGRSGERVKSAVAKEGKVNPGNENVSCLVHKDRKLSRLDQTGGNQRRARDGNRWLVLARKSPRVQVYRNLLTISRTRFAKLRSNNEEHASPGERGSEIISSSSEYTEYS